MPSFPQLLSPLQVGRKEARNRIVSTAHGEQWAHGGLITEHLIQYHERRAAGGTGLLVTFGSASIYPAAANASLVSLWDERNEPGLTEMAARVRAHGALLLAQATHRGIRETPMGADDPLQAPSPLPGSLKQGYLGAPQILSIRDIEAIVEAYGDAAARLQRCGWDGVELTALGTHLMEQFWSPVSNTRMDRYGGDLDGRMRFSFEILQRVAEVVSPDFLVCFRISGDPASDLLGLSEDDLTMIARKLDAFGRVDVFSVSGGSGVNIVTHAAAVPNDTFPVSVYNYVGRRMKTALSAPVIVAGRILTPADAETALSNGDCDLVAMTRALIADPDLPRRAAAGEVSRIRPCIAINEGCRRVTIGKSLACSVNAGVADAAVADFAPAPRRRFVSVVGGGPGGMEAARVAAERGHQVKLYERSGRLGGQMHAYARVAGHPHLMRHVEWLESELHRLGVDILLHSDVGPDRALEGAPDTVILATGARVTLPPEARGLRGAIGTEMDVIDGMLDIIPGTSVLVFDFEGRLRGPSIACLAAEKNASRVELAFAHDVVSENLEPPNKPAIFRRLAEAGVICTASHILIEPGNTGLVRLRDIWTDRIRILKDVDVVVFTGYRVAETWLSEELRAARPELELHVVGDGRAPRMLRNAVAEGARAGAAV